MRSPRRIVVVVGALVVTSAAAVLLFTLRHEVKRWFTPTMSEIWHDSKSLRSAATPSDPNAGQAARFERLAQAILDTNALYLGDRHVATNRERVARLSASAPAAEALAARMAYAQSLVVSGSPADSLPLYDECLALARKLGGGDALIEVLLRKSLAWLRIAESGNCVMHHGTESCIFPLSPAAVHTDRRGAEGAVATLTELLAIAPKSYGAMWLLNVAHMQLGDYPDAVPAAFRIEPAAFASENDVGRFVDVAVKAGVNSFSRAGGAIMDDFTNDGNLDIVTSSMDATIGLKLFRNDCDGTFTDIGPAVGIAGFLGGLQIVHGDINNDGRLDLLVLRGGWLSVNGALPNSLLEQQPDGTFLDVTEAAGIEICAPTQTAAFADIDNDGDLDLYIGYESDRDVPACRDHPCRLFRNRGDGRFDDITREAGVANLGFCKGVTFGDYDGDRLPDLYVSNFKESNRLFHNEGGGRFTDVTERLGVGSPTTGFATFFFDYDNDGWLDLFATDYLLTGNIDEIGAWYKEGRLGRDTCRLYKNDGRGGFTDVTTDAKLRRMMFPMGASMGDIDNDGFQDMYLATGDPQFSSLWPNIMLRNAGGKVFEDVTTSSGTGHLQKGHGVAFGDYDNDGDQDLFEQLGGAFKADAFWDALFQNPGNENHWLTVRLVGHRSNRFGVGARITVAITEASGTRNIVGFVGTVGSFGGNSLQQELGLGQATRIESLEVFWPTTGQTQRFVDVPLDRIIEIDEGRTDVKRIEAKRFAQ